MIINYHTHSGWNNDDSSHYDGLDTAIDTDLNIATLQRETQGWDCYNGSYGPTRELSSHFAQPLSWAQQIEIYTTLEPFITTAKKYSHRDRFQFFNMKHYRLLWGRLSKACKIAGKSDYHGVDNLSDVFILPQYGIVVRIYCGPMYPSVDHYFKVSIQPIHDEESYWFYVSEDLWR